MEHQLEDPPEFIIDNIRQALQENKNIYEAFYQKEQDSLEEVPPRVWENINDELDIDRIWEKISSNITQEKSYSLQRPFLLVLLFFMPFLIRDPLTIYDYKNIKVSLPYQNKAQIVGAQPIANEYDTSIQKFKPSKNSLLIANESRLLSLDKKNNSEEKVSIVINQQPKNYQLIKYNSTLIESCERNNVHTEQMFKRLNDKPSKGKINYGLLASINNTWLINNETTDAFRKNSLGKNQLSFGYEIGGLIKYNFHQAYNIELDLIIRNSYTQRTNTFYQGEYIEIKNEINTSKINLMFGKEGKTKIVLGKFTKNTLQIGGFVEYLHQKLENGNKRNRTNYQKFEDVNYGLRATLGKQILFEKTILELGVNFNYGLQNLNNRNTKNIDKISSISNGLYIKSMF